METRFCPRALIFDMDGLLVDSEPLWFQVERDFVRDRGGEWTEALAIAGKGQGVERTLRRMGHAFGFDIDEERDKAELVDRFIARVHEIALKPGALELLHAAKGRLPVALASSSPRRLVLAVLDGQRLKPYFNVIVTGESVENTKPAPDIFLRAAGELGVPAGECVVFEDSLAGVSAGRAAGMTVIAVPEGEWEGRGFEECADAIASDLVEARRLLDLEAHGRNPL